MRRGQRRDGGAALVEFALVLPILTLFLFGIIQFGIAYDKQQSINSGAREAARLGALSSSNLTDISTRAVAAAAMSTVGNDPKVVVTDAGGGVAGVRCPGGTYSGTDTCGSTTSVLQSDPTEMPCGDDDQSLFVNVVLSTPYDITIPFFGVMTVTIDSEAEFRCE